MTLIVCVCMCMYLYVSEVPKSLHVCVCMCVYMCMYCMYSMYVLVCCMYCMHPPRQALMPSQQALHTPGGGGNQRAPLRTAMSSSPATLSRGQGPIPRPVLAHPCALHASGGPKLPPCTAHGPSNHNGHLMTPSWAPSKLIWVGGAAHRSRVLQQQHLKTPSRHWISGLCMCMYVYVCVCMCMYVCIHVYVCACI